MTAAGAEISLNCVSVVRMVSTWVDFTANTCRHVAVELCGGLLGVTLLDFLLIKIKLAAVGTHVTLGGGLQTFKNEFASFTLMLSRCAV